MSIKSTKELRAFLLQQMEDIASGEVDVSQSKAICNLSQQVYNSINIELKLASAKAKYGEEAVDLKPLSFGD